MGEGQSQLASPSMDRFPRKRSLRHAKALAKLIFSSSSAIRVLTLSTATMASGSMDEPLPWMVGYTAPWPRESTIQLLASPISIRRIGDEPRCAGGWCIMCAATRLKTHSAVMHGCA